MTKFTVQIICAEFTDEIGEPDFGSFFGWIVDIRHDNQIRVIDAEFIQKSRHSVYSVVVSSKCGHWI